MLVIYNMPHISDELIISIISSLIISMNNKYKIDKTNILDDIIEMKCMNVLNDNIVNRLDKKFIKKNKDKNNNINKSFKIKANLKSSNHKEIFQKADIKSDSFNDSFDNHSNNNVVNHLDNKNYSDSSSYSDEPVVKISKKSIL